MSHRSKSILCSVLNNFINSLKPRKFKTILTGRDYLGNEYFEIPSEHGSYKRSSRWYKPKGNDRNRFDEPLPVEWDSWLRHRRKDPPSEEEILSNLELLKEKKMKSLEIEAKFGTAPKIEQHASSGNFPKYEDYEHFPGKKPKG